MSSVEKTLADYFVDAICHDYLLCILITSYTGTKKKGSANLPFGLGKTTLAFWLSFYLNGKDWDKVFETSVYNPLELARLLKPMSKRKNCAVWDDVQATAPAVQGVPIAIRSLANFVSTQRPEVACIVMTAPNISAISSPLRKLVTFEIIVRERGIYEVQKIVYRKNFKDPLQDLARLEYVEETAQDAPFEKLPESVQDRYNVWRSREKLKLYPNLLSQLEGYIAAREFDESGQVPNTLTGKVIHSGRCYSVMLPEEIGRQLHKKQVTFTVPREAEPQE
jgi:hypothetical protein